MAAGTLGRCLYICTTFALIQCVWLLCVCVCVPTWCPAWYVNPDCFWHVLRRRDVFGHPCLESSLNTGAAAQ